MPRASAVEISEATWGDPGTRNADSTYQERVEAEELGARAGPSLKSTGR